MRPHFPQPRITKNTDFFAQGATINRTRGIYVVPKMVFGKFPPYFEITKRI